MAKKNREKHAKKLNKRKIIWLLLVLTLIGIAITSLIKILKWNTNNQENEKILEEVSKAVTIVKTEQDEEKYEVDFHTLKQQNSDIVAFLKVNGTNIETPVVKTTNNDYYLTHNFKKQKNSAGWIFADYKNKLDGTDKNLVIYGHNTKKDNLMFSSLTNITKKEWYNNKENNKITLITEEEYVEYQVFSVYEIKNENYYIQTNFKTEAEFSKFIGTIKNRSIKDFEVEVTEKDNILTLSTCANNKNYRIVLHARKM